jgi:hypothetical protein
MNLPKYINNKSAMYYLNLLNKPSGVQGFYKEFGIPKNVNLSGTLDNCSRNGLLKSKKIDGLRIWTITKKGKELANSLTADDVFSIDDLNLMSERITNGFSTKKENVPEPNISLTANGAINGITQLIEENQKLHATLKGIYLQLDRMYGVKDEPNKK